MLKVRFLFQYIVLNTLRKETLYSLQIKFIQKPKTLDVLLPGDIYIPYTKNTALLSFVHEFIANIKR